MNLAIHGSTLVQAERRIARRAPIGAFRNSRRLHCCLLIVMALRTPVAAATEFNGCPSTMLNCPDQGGIVTVDERYDFNSNPAAGDLIGASRVIDAAELQCAIDCLDGDTDPDWALDPTDVASLPAGGKILLVPRMVGFHPTPYWIQRTVQLPAGTLGSLEIDGRGATIDIRVGVPPAWPAIPSGPVTGLSRIVAGVSSPDALEAYLSSAEEWVIENVQIRGVSSTGGGLAQYEEGVRIDLARNLALRDCTVSKCDVGVRLHGTVGARLTGNVFVSSAVSDVALAEWTDALTPALTSRSDSNVLTSNRHRVLAPLGPVMSLANATGTVIEGALVTDSRPPTLVHAIGSMSTLVLRDSVLAWSLAAGGQPTRWPANAAFDYCVPPTPLIANEGIKFLHLDGIEVSSFPFLPPCSGTSIESAEFLYEVLPGTGARTQTIIEHTADRPPLFMRIDAQELLAHEFSFVNTMEWRISLPPMSRGRWLDASGELGGLPPVFLRDQGFTRESIPVGSEVATSPWALPRPASALKGTIWRDPTIAPPLFQESTKVIDLDGVVRMLDQY